MDLLVGTGVVTALEIVQEIVVPGLVGQSCFFFSHQTEGVTPSFKLILNMCQFVIFGLSLRAVAILSLKIESNFS